MVNSTTKKIAVALLCILLTSCGTLGGAIAEGVIDTAISNALGITDEYGDKTNVVEASANNYIAKKKVQKKSQLQKTQEILKNY